MKRVTINDVARSAGVSASAVSRVFTDGASASPRTREKVLSAAQELGYRPSPLARGLVGQRTNLVTVVLGTMIDAFDAEFLGLLSSALSERGIRLMMTATGQSEDDQSSGLLQALDYRSDAVIVAAGTMTLDQSEMCAKAGLPVILSGRVMEGFVADSALADNRDGGRQAADLLTRTGCKRLAYFGRGGSTFSDRERRDGFVAAAKDAGYDPIIHSITGEEVAPLFDSAIALLSRSDRPDGVFCGNDILAVQVLEAARALGLAIPDDVSVIGFDNISVAAHHSYRLTTLNYPVESLVQEIVGMLDRRVREPEHPNELVRIQTQMIIRGTTRSLPPI